MNLKDKKPGPHFQPLYQQVQQLITERIVEGEWKPGEMLPSEFQLADLLGVSQGTVRKALNALTEERVVFRRQGVGTFVSEHTLQKLLFHFFHFTDDDGVAEFPNAELKDISLTDADDEVAQALDITPGSRVLRIHRVRTLNERPSIRELIYLAYKDFGDLHKEASLPHSLYHFYQKAFNITVHKAADRLKATLANAEDAEQLSVEIGHPLLQVSRVARALDGRIVEYRVSRANSDHLHYLVELN
jgi:GntR family transcriptional regulator